MPFDGREPCLEIQIIDKALEILGPNGEKWIQGYLSDRHGGKCIVGAIRSAKRRLHLKDDSTIAYILRALYAGCPPRGRLEFIELYNDKPGRTFDEIARLLVQARNLAANRC